MDQAQAVPVTVVGRATGVHLQQLVADRLDGVHAVKVLPSSADRHGDLSRRLSDVCGTVITVGWSALQLELIAVRADGAPLTARMQEAFQCLLRDESDRGFRWGL